MGVVERPGAEPLALVDVAVTRKRFVDARAPWRHDLCERFVTFADPIAVGLSSLARLPRIDVDAVMKRATGPPATCVSPSQG